MLKETKWKYLFLLLILCDVAYTFVQNVNTMELDGDMAGIIVPSADYQRVLSDPLGLAVVRDDATYPATNRFFIHFFMQKYFRSAPFIFQLITNPVESVFLSIAVARTLFQLLILYLIAAMVSGTRNPLKMDFVVSALCITPLFQVNGYYHIMAITLNSITYSFFYALPIVFLLLYFLPFTDHFVHGKPMAPGFPSHLLLAFLALTIAFGGPLSGPVAILIAAFILVSLFVTRFSGLGPMRFTARSRMAWKAIQPQIRIHFPLLILVCLYSQYIGTHNSENLWHPVPLIDRYRLLWQGLWYSLTVKLGLPVLLGMCILNTLLVSRLKNGSSMKTANLIRLLGVFSLVYVLLLPLGGFREYRPNIIRSDTLSPVTVAMVIVFGRTFLVLFAQYTGRARKALIAVFLAVAFIYTNADRYIPNVNRCQKDYLWQLSASSDTIVALHGWCNLLSWGRINNPEDSRLDAELIRYWGITDNARLYYQPD